MRCFRDVGKKVEIVEAEVLTLGWLCGKISAHARTALIVKLIYEKFFREQTQKPCDITDI